MAQTKIYPSTQAQVQAVQDTVDEINSKIVTPNYQVKTVTPSNVQQTVQADSGYTALSGVVVNPIAALMPESVEDFVMKTTVGNFSLNLNGVVPDRACQGQEKLVSVYGNITDVGPFAFKGCVSLQEVNLRSATAISGQNAFDGCTSLQSVDIRNCTRLGAYIFQSCGALKYVDARQCNYFTHSDFAYTALQLIDFTERATPATLVQPTAFDNIFTNWIAVVVDDNIKAAYQSATNWSGYASHFRTIAEVEQETGMSYDDYYLQCFGHVRNEVQA